MITGHSQGGHAATAVGQALRSGADPRLRVGGLAPIGGPFKPSPLAAKATKGESSNGVAYTAYWTVAWNRLHHLYDHPAEAFRAPSIEALFDGEHRTEEIFRRRSATYVDRVEHATGVLRAKPRQADGYYDQRLKQQHAKSTLIDLGTDVNHGRAAKLAPPRSLADSHLA